LRAEIELPILTALEHEVAEYLRLFSNERDSEGRHLVVRNGYLPKRTIRSGIGPVAVHQPRVRDRRVDRDGNPCRFSSKILPRYLRRTRSLEELIPWLYLKGVSTGDFTEALASLLGNDAPGLSATTVTRLKDVWSREYESWCRRDLSRKRYVYFWVDGIYCNVRLTDDRPCLLVVMGATAAGKKELIAVHGGERECEQS